MSVLDKAASAVTARALAWAIAVVLVLLGLLGLSVMLNVTQWADHRAYVKGEADRLELNSLKVGKETTDKIAQQKAKDDPLLLEGISRIEQRVRDLQKRKPPAPLPPQCAPGQERMDAVNAGADR